ncbi:MAG: four helix bundle protein [Patescibacteria group bacterium]
MAPNNPLQEKALHFAVAAVHACRILNQKREYVLSKQLLKSATSIGANIQEARFAQTKRDFLSKMTIALKEASETQYWITVIQASGSGSGINWQPLSSECNEITALLVSSTKTLKAKLQISNDYHS